MLLSCQINALFQHQSSPYCQISCSGIPNVMCKYSEKGPPICSNFTRGLSKKQKELLLNTHNQLRQRVALGKEPDQPSASNMMALVWDNEGEEIAQRWAEQCQKSYEKPFEDKCRTKLIGVPGGQNLNVEMPEKLQKNIEGYLIRRVNQWFLQGKHFQYTWSAEYLPTHTDSYSQIVWASTKSIGCGLSYNNSDTDSMYRFVCNYYPAGNVVGETIYKKGMACTECPVGSGCSKKWPGLCTVVADDMGGKIPSGTINTESSAVGINVSSHLGTLGLIVLFLFWNTVT